MDDVLLRKTVCHFSGKIMRIYYVYVAIGRAKSVEEGRSRGRELHVTENELFVFLERFKAI